MTADEWNSCADPTKMLWAAKPWAPYRAVWRFVFDCATWLPEDVDYRVTLALAAAAEALKNIDRNEAQMRVAWFNAFGCSPGIEDACEAAIDLTDLLCQRKPAIVSASVVADSLRARVPFKDGAMEGGE